MKKKISHLFESLKTGLFIFLEKDYNFKILINPTIKMLLKNVLYLIDFFMKNDKDFLFFKCYNTN